MFSYFIPFPGSPNRVSQVLKANDTLLAVFVVVVDVGGAGAASSSSCEDQRDHWSCLNYSLKVRGARQLQHDLS